MSSGKRLLYILAFADIQKIHVDVDMTTKQLIQEVEQVTERLTEKSENGFYIVDKHKASIFMYNKYFAGQAINKLSEYETAEEDGRLVILPKCKIGDRVYLPIDFENKTYSGKVHGFMYFEPRKEWVVKIRLDGTEIQYCYEAFKDFGNTFFLDYEEAEDKLKEMNKNE